MIAQTQIGVRPCLDCVLPWEWGHFGLSGSHLQLMPVEPTLRRLERAENYTKRGSKETTERPRADVLNASRPTMRFLRVKGR